MSNAPSLRTYLWLAGCAFIAVAGLSVALYLRYKLAWWALVLMLGTAVGAVIALLEYAVADPLEAMAKGPARAKDGTLGAPTAPAGRLAPAEARRLWRGYRAFQEQAATQRSALSGLEARVERAEREAALIRDAALLLRPEADVETVAPALMKELAAILGVPAVWLVPLRRHSAVPVLGPDGEPAWGEELRAAGLAAWEELLAEDRPLMVCLTDRAPYWRRHFAMESLWIVPLVYHKRAQGLLMARPEGVERTWTPGELALFAALSPVLAAALHPPRWSDVRRKGDDELPAPAAPENTPPSASWLVAMPGDAPETPPEPAESLSRREKRRRARAST